MVVDPLVGLNNLAELALKATPLLLCAIGIAIGCRANVWNIGAEGQFTFGGICGSWVALNFGGAGHVWALPLMLLAGDRGRCFVGGDSGVPAHPVQRDEILTTLMLTYVALHLLGYLVRGPWRDPAGFNFPETTPFADDVSMPIILPTTRLHLGALVALLVLPAAAFLMRQPSRAIASGWWGWRRAPRVTPFSARSAWCGFACCSAAASRVRRDL